MVGNNIRQSGAVILADYRRERGLRKTLTQTPGEVIADIKAAGLRGRGGAGFMAGLKWELTRRSPGTEKFVLCNADEGEPGTFKDRVLLTERADLMIEGMTIAGYAIGAETGIIYLRAEYAYLRRYLEDVLNSRRAAKLLGNGILGNEDFNFDIRVQMGAGAYVCGEETSLITSCEGTRGDPTDRTPFSGREGIYGLADGCEQCRNLLLRRAHHGSGAGVVRGHRHTTQHRHQAHQRLRRLCAPGHLRSALRHDRARDTQARRR